MATIWELNTSGLVGEEKLVVDVPAYNARVELDSEGISVELVPDSDFWLTISGRAHYAFVRVVDDIARADDRTIRADVERIVAQAGGSTAGR